MDNRAVSVAVTHALTISITAILLTSLLVSTGTFLDAQESRVAQEQFDGIGSDVVAHINALDTLNESGENVTAKIEPTYPRIVANEPYTIIIDEHDPTTRSDLDRRVFDNAEYDLRIESDALEQPIYFPVHNETTLDVPSRARGENPTIQLCETGKQNITFGTCP